MKTNYLNTAICSLAGLGLLAACATEPSQSDEARAAMIEARKGEKVDSACLLGGIDGFSLATNKSVVVRDGPNKQYLLETSSCFDLDNAVSLGVDQRSSCLSRGDRIIPYDSAFGYDGTGIEPQRCVITGIYEWKDAEEGDAQMTEMINAN